MNRNVNPIYKLDSLLTVEDVAAKFKVKARTVRAWITRRRIPFTRFERRVYFSAGVVEGMLQGNAVLPVPPHSRLSTQGGAQTQGETRK